MDSVSIILMAIALSMDAFAVSLAVGISSREHALKMSFSFGFFQAIMPMLGWGIGIKIKEFISSIDHWIAFLLLSFIGLKMVYEAEEMEKLRIRADAILLLSIATSLDAFIVGITLPFVGMKIFLPAFIIGIITFSICLMGFFLAKRIKVRKAALVGGIILIFVGMKILIQDLY